MVQNRDVQKVKLKAGFTYTAKTPPNTSGTKDVTVINLDDQDYTLKNAFTYNPRPKNLFRTSQGTTFRYAPNVQARMTWSDSSPPMIEKVLPVFISVETIEEITIEGSGFIRTPSVQIGGDDVKKVEFISSNELKVLTSRFFAVGPQDVVVINPDEQYAVLSSGVTVLAPPKIKSVEPMSGDLSGGTEITINGESTVKGKVLRSSYPSRFVEGVEVFIGKEKATLVTVQSDRVITAITPPNTLGPKDVIVINPDGQKDTLENAFTYNSLPQITKVIPGNGKLTGGTKITIQGSGFLSGAKVLISIDEDSFIVVSSVQVVSATTITAIASPNTPGTKDVTVINPDNQWDSLENAFTYNPRPKIVAYNYPNSFRASQGTTRHHRSTRLRGTQRVCDTDTTTGIETHRVVR